MRTRSAVAVLGYAAVTAVVFAACTDGGVTAPESNVAARENAASTNLLGGLLGLFQVAPVTRNTPLASDVTWSFTVGAGGTTSSNSAVGLTIKVPSGALSQTTTITVTALAGSPVAYKFEPHGLQFSKNVTLTQKLQGTSAGSELLPLLQGAYFASDEPIISGGLALVTELISGLLNPLSRTFSFGIGHFSGYLLASGHSDGGSSEGSSDAQ